MITEEEIIESCKYADEADNMLGLIKAVHCVNPKIDIIHIGPSLFGRKKDE